MIITQRSVGHIHPPQPCKLLKSSVVWPGFSLAVVGGGAHWAAPEPGEVFTQDDEVSMSPKKDTHQSAKNSTAAHKTPGGFTDEERAAMKERAQELKAGARRGQRTDQADGESDVLAKIAEMPEPDRA